MTNFKKSETSETRFLTVNNIPNRDIFTILDEAKPYKGQFTKGEEAICNVRKKKTNEEYQFVFKTFNINNMVDVFGEDSKNWVGKDIEISRKYSDKFRKNFLAVTAIIPEVDLEEGPF